VLWVSTERYERSGLCGDDRFMLLSLHPSLSFSSAPSSLPSNYNFPFQEGLNLSSVSISPASRWTVSLAPLGQHLC